MRKIIVVIIFLIYTSFLSKMNAQTVEIDSLEVLLKNNKKQDTIQVKLLNEISSKLFNHDNNKALEYASKAVDISDRINFDKGKALGFKLIAISYYYKSDYPASLSFFQKSWKVSQKMGDKIGESKCLNNIGAIHYAQGNFQEALEYYKKSLNIDVELEDEQGITKSLNNIGGVYFSQKKYTKAIEYYNKSLEIKEKLKDKRGISVIYNNLADVYEDSGDLRKALEFHKKALKLKKEIADNSSICLTYYNIGTVYLKKKEYSKALKYAKKSLEIAKKLDLLNRQTEIYEVLYNIYNEKKQYKKALENYVLYKELNERIFNEKNIKEITGLEYQYKYEKEKEITELEQQKKNIIAEKEVKHQEKLRNLFIVGFLMMFLLALAVLYSFLQKRKANTILAKQKHKIEETNEELNQTNEELNSTLEVVRNQKTEIEKTHKNIQASINYASRIQYALLPDKERFNDYFNAHFILYKPKDIVSGDFYYLKKVNKYIVIAAADCTGHGVPGAFVSMLGISFLNEIIRNDEIKTASQILEELRTQIKTSLKQSNDKYSNKDGMDIALCVIDTETNKLNYSGAYNPLYIYRKSILNEIKATRNPIGSFIKEKPFQNNEIQLERKDRIYLFSDGYIDQFGGETGGKFKVSQFRKLISSIQNQNLNQQKEILSKTIDDWKSDKYNQIDDMLIIGLEI